ncbi:hypothetical protein [Methyloceanibacter superfactus]|jgi:hypothetical protein|nr:hypothetical protein [Methyloceanibacter superfactus]
MMKQNRVVLIVIAAALGLAMAPSAMAAPKDFCKNYARKAVGQSNAMQAQGRGCTGFRWHNWYDGHYQWCRDVSKDSAWSEYRVRRNAIFNNGPC